MRRQESILKVSDCPRKRSLSADPRRRAQLVGLINDRGGEFEHFRKSDEELKKMKKSVRAFYIEQNEILVSRREERSARGASC